MSFFDIKDPVERNKMIADYLAAKKILKERSLEERGELIDRRRDLEKKLNRVSRATKRWRKKSSTN